MTPHPLPLAILPDLGFTELLVVALASVVIFGRRLPQVAARGFAEFHRLRRALTQTWRDTGIEDEIRRVQRDIDRSLPRDFDPTQLARRETREIERKLRRDGRSLPRSSSLSAAKPQEPTESAPQETSPPDDPLSKAWREQRAERAEEQPAAGTPESPGPAERREE